MHKLTPFLLSIVITIISTFFLTDYNSTFAQNGYPLYDEKYINDYADIISEADENRIRSQFSNVDDRTGIEATVLTIGSIRDYDTGDETIESFATNLFNVWGIGSTDGNEGILILVSLNDQQIRIELADGFKGEHDAAMKRIIDDEILPDFRDGNFSEGVRSGSLSAIERIATRQLQILGSGDQSAVLLVQPEAGETFIENEYTNSVLIESSDTNDNSSDLTRDSNSPASLRTVAVGAGIILLMAALGVGGVRALFQFFERRDKPRACPNCTEMMEKLDEVSDDLYLNSGQQAEEFLKTVNYDVWQCPNCQAHSVYPYAKWFSGYSDCPQCSYQALKKMSNVTARPTTFSTGRKEIRSACRHCDYDRTETVILPRVEKRSSSSSGSSFSSGSLSRRSSSSFNDESLSRRSSSSFSDGSSSGGGASGSW